MAGAGAFIAGAPKFIAGADVFIAGAAAAGIEPKKPNGAAGAAGAAAAAPNPIAAPVPSTAGFAVGPTPDVRYDLLLSLVLLLSTTFCAIFAMYFSKL